MDGYVYYSTDDLNWDLQNRGPFTEQDREALLRSERQRNAAVFESEKRRELAKFGYRFAIIWLESGTMPKQRFSMRTRDLAKLEED